MRHFPVCIARQGEAGWPMRGAGKAGRRSHAGSEVVREYFVVARCAPVDQARPDATSMSPFDITIRSRSVVSLSTAISAQKPLGAVMPPLSGADPTFAFGIECARGRDVVGADGRMKNAAAQGARVGRLTVMIYEYRA